MRRYRAHKIVQAEKIVGITPNGYWLFEDGEGVFAGPALQSRVPDGVDPIGGYLVVYPDGFTSWSPAKAFEDGYSPVQ